jgi:26S proteasome regulatory subunit T5
LLAHKLIVLAEIRIMRSDLDRIRHETNSQREKIKDNTEKIKLNKQLPWLVGNVIEVLALTDEPEEEEDGAAMDTDAVRGGKSCVMKTSTRQTIFLPIPGLVPVDELTPGDLVGTNKDSYLILEKLPAEYDNRCATHSSVPYTEYYCIRYM